MGKRLTRPLPSLVSRTRKPGASTWTASVGPAVNVSGLPFQAWVTPPTATVAVATGVLPSRDSRLTLTGAPPAFGMADGATGLPWLPPHAAISHGIAADTTRASQRPTRPARAIPPVEHTPSPEFVTQISMHLRRWKLRLQRRLGV